MTNIFYMLENICILLIYNDVILHTHEYISYVSSGSLKMRVTVNSIFLSWIKKKLAPIL